MELSRLAHLGQKCRIHFLTDAEDHYFTRKYDRGEFTLESVTADSIAAVPDYVGPNLARGKGSLSFELLPSPRCGDKLRYRALVVDSVTQTSFENYFELTVAPAQEHRSEGHNSNRKPPGQQPGTKQDGSARHSLSWKFGWLGQGSPAWNGHFLNEG